MKTHNKIRRSHDKLFSEENLMGVCSWKDKQIVLWLEMFKKKLLNKFLVNISR